MHWERAAQGKHAGLWGGIWEAEHKETLITVFMEYEKFEDFFFLSPILSSAGDQNAELMFTIINMSFIWY